MKIVIVPLVWAVASLSCSETLPPYEDPRDIVSGTATGRYSLTSQEDLIHVTLSFSNDLTGEVNQGQ
jgi:hypothetical protein